MRVYTQVHGLEGRAKVRDGECVALVQEYTDAPATGLWRPGKRVVESGPLWPGTAIATFVKGRYPLSGSGTRHAALFLQFGPLGEDGLPNGFWMMEQFNHPPIGAIQARYIRRAGVPPLPNGAYQNASNNADAFYVIR